MVPTLTKAGLATRIAMHIIGDEFVRRKAIAAWLARSASTR